MVKGEGNQKWQNLKMFIGLRIWIDWMEENEKRQEQN